MELGKKIRVLIADDSAFMRKVLLSILSADPQLEVVGEARDGRDAVAQAETLRPDVITMDVNMPHMDGLQATEQIMSSNPRPVVIVSSESRDGAETTLRALELGAIDFVAKPSSGIDLDMNTVREELCRKVRLASKVRVVRTASRRIDAAAVPIQREPVAPRVATLSTAPSSKPAGRFPIVVVAASTGGPATLTKMIPLLPRDLQAAVILVQHMPATFTSQFSEQLAKITPMRVKDAEAGEIVQPGVIYVCPGSHHMRISATGRTLLDDGPRVGGYRPCADLTLETAAQYSGAMTVGVILTGMGNDGSRGAQVVKSVGGHVIAQDEASSVIFGMPSEAIKTGAVDQVLDVMQIPAAIEKRVLYSYGAVRVGAL